MPMESQPFIVLIKCMSVLFEVLSAFILYHWVAKRYDSQLGKLAFGLFLNPAIFMSVWYSDSGCGLRSVSAVIADVHCGGTPFPAESFWHVPASQLQALPFVLFYAHPSGEA